MDRKFFPESWKRFDRAVTHLEAFQAEWQRVTDPNSYEFVTEPNREWTYGCIRIRAKSSRENSLALELGEFFYNMRAALDSTIYQAAVFLEKTDPPAKADSLEFPICDTETRFQKAAIDKRKFPPDLVSWITSIQPYNAPNTTDPGIRDLMEHLLLLHNCARKDRHRLLHVVAAIPTHVSCKFHVEPLTIKICNGKGVWVNFLESDDPFFFFEIQGADLTQPCNIKLETALTVEVSVDQIPIPPGSGFDSEIKKICAAVEYVVGFFEAGFDV
jgi:hypothetical protein